MNFEKEFLKELTWGDDDAVVYDNIIDHGRWSVTHEMVFKHEGKFYMTTYRVGATESQDESPYEYEDDMIPCDEVFEKTKTVTYYE